MYEPSRDQRGLQKLFDIHAVTLSLMCMQKNADKVGAEELSFLEGDG